MGLECPVHDQQFLSPINRPVSAFLTFVLSCVRFATILLGVAVCAYSCVVVASDRVKDLVQVNFLSEVIVWHVWHFFVFLCVVVRTEPGQFQGAETS